MTFPAGATGYAPIVKISGQEPEQVIARPNEKDIYKQLWAGADYRKYSPGEHVAHEFLRQVKPKPGSKVLDLGCGSGRGGLTLALLGGMEVTFVDFADNCLDIDIKNALKTQSHALSFIEADLTKKLPVTAQYGFCTDVMEHIPEDKVNNVLNNCLMAAQHVFFQICTVKDHFGESVGHSLHLTVRPFEWWLDQFKQRDCVIHWSKNEGHNALFYVSAWITGTQVVNAGVINTTDEQIRKNVEHNIAQDWMQVSPHETNELEIMIVGGGPSLSNYVDEIKQKRAEGVKLITMNGSYNWALENGLTPSAQIMVDAREHNKRFSKPVVDKCVYLIASQVHADVLDGLPKDRTYLWHTSAETIRDLLKKQYGDLWYPIPGGSTVLLRAIPLMRMLGYSKFHLYGCDSCITENQHHAYSQPENDTEVVIPVEINGRIFKCHAWMVAQAQEFIDMIKVFGDVVEIATYGDGLLNHIIKSSADLSENTLVLE